MNDESPDLQTSSASGDAHPQPDAGGEAAVAKKKRSKVSAKAAAAALDAAGDQPMAADALRVHAGLLRQIDREVGVAARFTDAFPQVPTAEVTAQPADVHDVDGLRTIGAALAG